METLRIIIGDLNNEDLPVYGRTSLRLESKGDGGGLVKLKFRLDNGNPFLKLEGDAEFTNSSGFSLGKEYQLSTDGVVYIKVFNGISDLFINDSFSITGLGLSTEVFATRLDSTNSPMVIADLSSLLISSPIYSINQPMTVGMSVDLDAFIDKEGITYFNTPNSGGANGFGSINSLSNFNLNHLRLSGNGNIVGNISSISEMTNLKYLGLDATSITGDFNFISNLILLEQVFIHSSIISIDLKNIPPILNTIRSSGNTSFTGDENTFIGRNLQWIEANLNALPTAQLDNLIKACDKATWSGLKRLRLKGTRSVDSDVAFNSLISKGVDVSIVP